MLNVICFLSNVSQYDKLLSVLNKLNLHKDIKILILSFEKWTDTRFLQDRTEFAFDYIVVPRENSSLGHYRNTKFIQREFVDNLELIQMKLESIPDNRTVLIKDYIRKSQSFNIESIVEAFLPNVETVIYVQKHLFADTIFWPKRVATLRSFGKFIIAYCASSKKRPNYRLLKRVVMRFLKTRWLFKRNSLFCCFNLFAYQNLKMNSGFKSVISVNNLFIRDLIQTERPLSIKRGVYFITSGSFKYASSIRQKKELHMIERLKEISFRNGYDFYIKIKDGEKMNLLKQMQKLNLLGVRILEGEPFNRYNISSVDIVIAPLSSSVFLESVISNIPTYFYDHGSKFKDLYSFLPLDMMRFEFEGSDLNYLNHEFKGNELIELKNSTLRAITCPSKVDIADLILMCKNRQHDEYIFNN